MTKINVALAGFGKGGRIYNAPIIASIEGFEIKKILTSNEENIKAAREDFPQAEVVGDYESILQDRNIDLVILVTPNHHHKDLAERALKADKHVIVEKPFTPTVEEANELITLAGERQKVLSINHNRRWDSDFLTVEKLIQEDRLGKVVEYEAHFDRFRTEIKDSWKERKDVPGSGILYDLGSHLIHQALVLFGNPQEVSADLRFQREGTEVPDNFDLLLSYPDLRVRLKAGMLVKEKGPTFSVFGRKGNFLKYGADVQEEALQNGKRPNETEDWGVEPEQIWGRLNTIEEERKVRSEAGDYRKLYRNVYNTILGKEKLKITPEEARNVIKVIELAIQSDGEKKRISFR